MLRKSAIATKAEQTREAGLEPLPGASFRSRPRLYIDLDRWLGFKSVQTWLGGLIDEGQRKRIYDFARYGRWRAKKGLESDLDELIRICDEGTVKDLKRQAEELKAWLESDDFHGVKKSSRDRYEVDVRAFFRASMIDLPRFKIVVPVSEVQGLQLEQEVTGTKFLELVKRVLANGKLSIRGRSITLTIVQTFSDNSTLVKVHNFYLFPQLAKFFGTTDYHAWDLSLCPAGPVFFTRPKNVEAGHEPDPKRLPYTFMHRDGVQALIEWLDERKRQTGREIQVYSPAGPRFLPQSDPICIMADGRPMSARHPTNLFCESGKRARVNMPPTGAKQHQFQGSTKRYQYHPHECRDCGITLAKPFKVDPAALQLFTGHEIDKLGYDKSPWDDVEYYRMEYDKLGPALNVITGGEILVKREFESREKEIRTEFEALRRNFEELQARLLASQSDGSSHLPRT
jgi:hypothetical protein